MGEVISTINLTKIYGNVRAVDRLNLSIKEGEIYGFLGLNGAGKTTTIRMLLAMVGPTSGRSYLQGKEINKRNTAIWKDVGYIVETPYSYPQLTVEENLDLVAKLRGIENGKSLSEIIERLGLGEYRHIRAKNLSMGNGQRLGIAKALIHKPKILLLDEPTNGLDPAGIVEVRKLLGNLAKNRGVTILISSHKLDEISKLASKIGIIHEGRLVREMDGNQIESRLKKSLIIGGRDISAMKSILTQAGYKPWLRNETNGGDSYLQIDEERAVIFPDKIATLLVNASHPPTLIKIERENLESYFLRTINKSEGV